MKTLIETEARIQVLEQTRQHEAEKANAAMLPLQMQLAAITQRATAELSRIDGQLIVLKEQVEDLKPAAEQPVATDVPLRNVPDGPVKAVLASGVES